MSNQPSDSNNILEKNETPADPAHEPEKTPESTPPPKSKPSVIPIKVAPKTPAVNDNANLNAGDDNLPPPLVASSSLTQQFPMNMPMNWLQMQQMMQPTMPKSLFHPAELPVYSGEENTITPEQFRDSLLSAVQMLGGDDRPIRARLPFQFKSLGRTWFQKKDRTNQTLKQILDELVNESVNGISEFSLRVQLKKRVQLPGERVVRFVYAVREIAQRLEATTGQRIPESTLAMTVLEGILDILKPYTFQQLMSKLGNRISLATVDQVQEAAEAAEALAMLTTQMPATQGARFPAHVNAIDNTYTSMDLSSAYYPVPVSGADKSMLPPADAFGYTRPPFDYSQMIQAANKATEQLTAAINEVKNLRVNPYARGEDRQRKDTREPSEDPKPDGGRRGREFKPRGPRPEKPNRDCRVCLSAGIEGDIKHWIDQCPLVQRTVANAQATKQPPPPPHTPANANATGTQAPVNKPSSVPSLNQPSSSHQ